jgi:pyruvate kinase
MKSLAKLKKIKGDASFREFYRNRENKSIIVISKKEKLKNLFDILLGFFAFLIRQLKDSTQATIHGSMSLDQQHLHIFVVHSDSLIISFLGKNTKTKQPQLLQLKFVSIE